MTHLHSTTDYRAMAAAVVSMDEPTGKMVTNSEAKVMFINEERTANRVDERNIWKCSRCALRGVDTWTNINHTQVCHVPFTKAHFGWGNRSPLSLLMLGCETCNRDDADWGMAHDQQRRILENALSAHADTFDFDSAIAALGG